MTSVLIPSLFLAVFGIFNILGIRQALFYRQASFLIASLIVYLVLKKIGRRFFQINSKFFYWLFVAILIVTYIIGLEVKGSKRWIDLYFFNFQGSEFFKVFFILFLARYLSGIEKGSNTARSFTMSLVYFAIPFFIIFKQPDLGNAMVYAFIFLAMIFFSQFPKKFILNMAALVILALPGAWFFLKPYQKERITSFIDPHIDQHGNSYNMIQAVITIGSGKFFGRGLGLGTQSRLFFLPENNTDFAYSSLVEQFGFFGGLLVIILYIVIFFFMTKKILNYYYSRTEEDKENFLYLIGFLSYFIFQVFVNLGMNLGVLPIAGIALPFISYGGSSWAALMAGIALMP